MEKIILVILLVFSSCCFAEWVKYFVEDGGNEHFYDDERLRDRGDSVYVWTRIQYFEQTKYGDWGTQRHQQLNCTEYSVRVLEWIWYSDKNWSIERGKVGRLNNKEYIKPNTSIEKIADIVCKK